jgi:hypothetical protein
MLTPSLPYTHFSHIGDTCNLGSNGSTKLKESLLFSIPFWRAALVLVLECYASKGSLSSLLDTRCTLKSYCHALCYHILGVY